jgi:hypothetical protein
VIVPGAPVEDRRDFVSEFKAANERLAKLMTVRAPEVTFVDGVPAVGVSEPTTMTRLGA